MSCKFCNQEVLSCYVTSGYCQFLNIKIDSKSSNSSQYEDILDNIIHKKTIDTVKDAQNSLRELQLKTPEVPQEDLLTLSSMKSATLNLLEYYKMKKYPYNYVLLVEDLQLAVSDIQKKIDESKDWQDVCSINAAYHDLVIDPTKDWF